MKSRTFTFAAILAILISMAGCTAQEAIVTPAVTPSAEATRTPEPSDIPEKFDGTILVVSESQELERSFEDAVVLRASALLPRVSIEGRNDVAAAINAVLGDRLAPTEANTEEAYNTACEAYSGLDEEGRDGWLACGWSSGSEVKRGDGAVLSLLCSSYVYTGGAHGSYEYFGLTFSTTTGKALSLEDLAADTEGLRAALESAVLAAAAQDSEGFFDIDGFAGRVFDSAAWYLTDDALVLVAQVGEVAAGARGMVEFAVPYSELEGLLKSEYLPEPSVAGGGAGDLSIAFAEDVPDVPVAGTVRVLSGSIQDEEYMVDYRIVAGADMGCISLRGSTIASEDSSALYVTGSEYAWINRLKAGEAFEISSVFMDMPLYCLVLSDGTVLQIAQSGKDGSLLLYEA